VAIDDFSGARNHQKKSMDGKRDRNEKEDLRASLEEWRRMTLMMIMRVAVPRMIVMTITDRTTVITSKCFLWVIYIRTLVLFFITTTKKFIRMM
jgi:hypothetical protein